MELDSIQNMPASELAMHVTRAIKAGGVNPTPLVAKTMDGAIVTKMSRPSTESPLRAGARGKLDLRGDRTHSHRTIAKILGRGYVRIQEMLSPTKFRCPLLDFQRHLTPATARGRISLGG